MNERLEREKGPELAGSPILPTLFPVFLRLSDRPVLLVGGGAVASAKLPELVRAGARVTVVAPVVHPQIEGRVGLTIARRPFAPADLDGVWFAIAAATPSVNLQVAAAGAERRVFVNAVDDGASATAYAGGVLRRGGVTIAVSTEGHAPALAGLLREGIESVIPEDVATWLAAAAALRAAQRAARVPMGERRPLLLRALNRLYVADGAGRAEERA